MTKQCTLVLASVIGKKVICINPAHPPLPKYLYGFLPFLASLNQSTDVQETAMLDGYWHTNPTVIYPFLRVHQSASDIPRNLLLGRAPAVALGLLGGFVVFLLTRKLGANRTAAAIAAFLLLFYAEYAGHSILMAFDVPLAVSCALVSLAAIRWWQHPKWNNGAVFVSACSLAILVKLPAVLFCAATILTLLALSLFNRKRVPVISTIMLIFCVGLGCYAACWGAALFRFSPFSSLPPETINVYHTPLPQHATGIIPSFVRFANENRLLPQQTLATLRHYILFNREVFFMGETSRVGWWSYFPISIALKTPLSLLLGLIPMGITLYGWLKKHRGKRWHLQASTGLILVVPFAILLISTMASGINMGHRIVLFLYIPWAIFLGISLDQFLRT